MMKTALFKNTFREIKNTKARFISILMIVAIGVGFFVGVKSTSPSMKQMAVDYYEHNNLMDFRVVSTVGFDENDVQSVIDTDGIKDVMPSYFLDVSVNVGGNNRTVRLMSAPAEYKDKNAISTVEIVEGRMPEKSGEVAVESSEFASYKIGDKFKVEPNVGETDISDQLNTLEYTVVGKVKSPMYISLERGTTTVGNGKIDEFAYISENDYALDRYTVLYATLDTKGEEISPFVSRYDELIGEVTDKLELTADSRVEVFTDENIGEAQDEIDDGYKKLEEEKAKVDKELSDAKKEIEKGERQYNDEIASATEQINSAQAEFDSGKAELDKQWKDYELAVTVFETEINKAKTELEEAQTEYDESYSQIEQLKETRTTLEGEMASAASDTILGIVSYLPPGTDQALVDMLNGYAQSVTAYNAVDVLTQVKVCINTYFGTAFDSAIDQAIAGISEYMPTLEQLNTAITAGEQQLAPAKEQLDAAYAEFDKKEKEGLVALGAYKSELEKAQTKLEVALVALENSRAQLEQAKVDGKKKLDDAKKEYEDAKKKAQDEFEKAEKELSDAQKELDKVGEIEWYMFDRDDNPGYSGFIDNTNRVDAVATVFPLFFLLVAMLVCLTTMTRLVEEKRTEIGTLKALGYSDRSITFKFVSYACLAALFGCLLGCFSCIPTLPRVIYNAYSMLYNMRDTIDIVVDKNSLYLAIIAAFACCALVTLSVCYKTLRHKPASLMRPKAPKAGKRILLERITVLWKHFNFSSKVTWRNLFRYKSRLFMTAIGIAGCTALMLTGFGLYDSINDVVYLQFDDLCKYNTIIVADEEKSAEDMKPLVDTIKADSRFSDTALVSQKGVTVSSQKATISSDVYLMVAQNPDDMQKLITLRDRTTGEGITLSHDGVVLSEKLAKKLGVSLGDEVTLTENKDRTTVIGITENYVYNYVYMSSTAYTAMTGEQALYSTVYTYADNLTTDLEKSLGTDYLKRDDTTAISFTSAIIRDFEDMISSMNIVVLVMIISAGALAMVVLYNLTNINLAERNREIATIKVLGFDHSETSAFVYRENIILTLFGIVIGLVLGVFLWIFVVETVEVDTVMFGRQIHLLSYFLATALTAAFALLVNAIMYFRIKAINMVESLKSIE